MTNAILHPDEIEGWRGVIEDGEVIKDHETAMRDERDSGSDESDDQYPEGDVEDVDDEAAYDDADYDEAEADYDEDEANEDEAGADYDEPVRAWLAADCAPVSAPAAATAGRDVQLVGVAATTVRARAPLGPA